MVVKGVIALFFRVQSRVGDKLLRIFGVCPQDGTAVLKGLSITGNQIKYDLRYTRTPTYFAIFTNNIWSYLLWSPVSGGDGTFFYPMTDGPLASSPVETRPIEALRAQKCGFPIYYISMSR